MPCGEFRVQLIAVCFSVAWRFSEAFFTANRSPTTMLRTVVRPGTAYRAVRQARTQLQVLKTSFSLTLYFRIGLSIQNKIAPRRAAAGIVNSQAKIML
jgi:hypothetical protein